MSKLTLYEHAVRALVYADSPEKQRRVVAENARRSLLTRSALNGSYSLIYRHPDWAKGVLALPYTAKGFDVIAFGRNSTVIRDGGSVLKIARASEKMAPDQQQKLVDELAHRHASSVEYLGDVCVDQNFGVAKHPIREASVVIAKQPFVEFEPFNHGMPPRPEQAAQLEDFADRSFAMEADTDLLSDASGTNNLGFDAEGKLVLVDTIPMKSSDGGPSIELARHALKQMARRQHAR